MTRSWAITAAAALLGDDDDLTHDVACHVEHGIITWVGPRHAAPAEPHEAMLLDAGDACLMPGLIDTHVHLALDGSSDPVALLRDSDPEQVARIMLASARDQVRAGVTTVRDLGSPWRIDREVADAAEEPGAFLPRVVTSGPPITVQEGHLWFMGGECASDDDLLRHVRRAAEAGATVVKMMVTGGFITEGTVPGAAQFTLAQTRLVVRQARSLGLSVAAHAHGTEGIGIAVEAGCDSIEHCSWVTPEGLATDERIIEEMFARSTVVCPTINTNARNPAGRLPWGRRSEIFRAMVERGIPFVAGTDAGIAGIPHGDLPRALEIMRDIGMDPRAVVRSATVGASRHLGLGATTGQLAVGLAADLLIVAGDPLRDLEVVARPRDVMVRGVMEESAA